MKRFIFTLLSVLFALVINAQERTITGRVTDAVNNDPLPGVNITVVEVGVQLGTITNPDGNYTINVPEGANKLLFSFVGYQDKTVSIDGRTEINVALQPEDIGLDEVVVIGYGTQKKSLVTGSISKVGSEDMEQNVSRIEQSLQGKSAGVNIMQESGSPGAGVTVRIRGVSSNRNSSPLFIVDGMRTGGMEYLNPDDIESVEVLKDAASAAIYGAEGANGVVLITTKSGSEGATKVNYSYSYGTQEVVNTIDVLNANQYATYFRQAKEHEIRSNFRDKELPDELVKKLVDNSYAFNPDTLGTGTNWMEQIFEVAPRQEHHISVQGGTEKTSVFASGSYLTQDGIVGGDKSNFSRYTARVNVDHDAKEWLKIGSKISFTHFDRSTLNENNEFGGVISNAMQIDPITPVYYDDTTQFPAKYKPQIYANFDKLENSALKAPGDNGYYGMSKYVQNELANPVAQINNTHNSYFQDKLTAGVYAEAEPLEGLKLRSVYDIDLAYGNNLYWTPRYYYHSINYNFRSSMGKATERWFTWQWENTINYSKSFGDHNITGLAGMTMRDYNHYYMHGRGEVLREENWDFAMLNAAMSDTTRAAATGYRDQNRLFSYFGRVQYDFKNKYMFNATIRSDGSSKLAEGNKFQYFPSFSLGWVVSRENFWPFDVLNFMKFRASWGQNGSIGSLGNFDYVSTISSNAEASYYLSGGRRLTGAEPTRLSNPDLVWETSEQTDIGIDMQLWDGMIAFSADYYLKRTIDLITEGAVPEYVGNTKPLVNAGDVVNEGVEMELTVKQRFGDFSYSISGNAAYMDNRVTYIGNQSSVLLGANLGTTGAITRSEENKPIWHFYGYQANGIFQTFEEIDNYTNAQGDLIQPNAIPGDVIFEDINQDGQISENDKTMIGNPHPQWSFGLTPSISYKNIDLNMFFQGRLGADVYFGAYRTDLSKNNKPEFFYTDAWTSDNPSGDWPRMTAADANNNFTHNSMFVYDGSYIRLQSVELGYTIPSSLTKAAGIQEFRVYVSGQNVFLWSDYPGDPEVGNTAGGFGNSIGIDRGLYPRARVLSMGLNLTF